VAQERGIAAGIRRIEALSGQLALRDARADKAVVDTVQSALNVDRSKVHETLRHLLEQNRSLQREVEKLKVAVASGGSGSAEDDLTQVDGIPVLVRGPQDGLDKDAVRALVDRSRQRLPKGIIVQWAVRGESITVTASVSKDLIPRLHAGEIVKELAALFEGRGGGRPDMAEAGGRRPGNLAAVRDRTLEILRRIVSRKEATR